jgi:hypothetical protein
MIKLFLSQLFNRIARFFLFLQAKILLNHGKDYKFFEHIMDPSWNYKPYRHKYNPYFLKYGFKYSIMEGEYYKQMTGVESDLYIPQTFFFYYLCPFLNQAGYQQDKNLFRKLLDVRNSKMDIIMPFQVIYNQGGVFYDSDGEACSKEDAIKQVLNYSKDIIVKPSTQTKWGKGVVLLPAENRTADVVRHLFDEYKMDFSFEEKMVQHSDLASFNPTSLNTTRIVTYRKLNGEIKFLYALQRFGGKGAVVDNVSAGGGMVYLSEDGLVDRTIKKLRSLKFEKLPDEAVNRVPYFQKMKETALYLHTKLPSLNYIGWDMSVTQEGLPVLIEYNTRPAAEGKQLTFGPAFSKEDLDEIMPEIAKWKLSYECCPMISFPGKKGYRGRINV